MAGLLAILAALLGRRLDLFGDGAGPPAAGARRMPASGPARERGVDWAGLARLAHAAPKAGAVDIFSGAASAPPKLRAASSRAAVKPSPPVEQPQPPSPAPPAPPAPPPPPPEDPLAAVRKDLASYRFVGYLQKTGDMIVFLAAGKDVFLVRKGDVIGRTRTVVVQDIREKEIFFLFPPDRRIRAVLKDNAPLIVN